MKGFPTQIEHLAQMGVLSKSDDEIQAAKREYKRMYKRESKKRQRSGKKEFRQLYTKDEIQKLQSSAKAHGKAVSTFIHNAALAYISQTFILPNPAQVIAMERILSRIYLDIRAIKEQLEKGSGNPRVDVLNLMRLVEELEGEFRPFMRKPPLLMTLVRDASPELRKELLDILQP